MSSTEDELIEHLIDFIGSLNEKEDTRSPQEKLDAAFNARKEIHERIDNLSLPEEYVLDINKRVERLIEILEQQASSTK